MSGRGVGTRAAAGTVVTVTVAGTDTESGARRHVQLREPEAWARAVFADRRRHHAGLPARRHRPGHRPSGARPGRLPLLPR